MKTYIIKIYSNVSYNGVSYKSSDLIEVTDKEMFLWIEISKSEDVKICIYEAIMVCDLS